MPAGVCVFCTLYTVDWSTSTILKHQVRSTIYILPIHYSVLCHAIFQIPLSNIALYFASGGDSDAASLPWHSVFLHAHIPPL